MRIVVGAFSPLMQARSRVRTLGLVSVAWSCALGCSESPPSDTTTEGGSSALSGGTTSGGGTSSTTPTSGATSVSSGGQSGGASSGGASASSGGSSGGSLGGGGGAPIASGGASGSSGHGPGGATNAGAGGAGAGMGMGMGGGSAGSTGTSGTPRPSAGCGKSGRPASGQVQVANTSIYMFPTGYDGTKPFPLLIALHACGNPNTEFVNLTNNTGFATDYVRAFPNTPDSGQCWSNYSGDIARITSQYDELMSNYCIDQNRVFAIAHSSGAQMLVNILSHKSDAQHLNLKGISPVAADPYNVAVPMPVLYIDGLKDNQRSADSAKNTVAKFRSANSCADTSKPYTAVMQCNSTDSGHPMVNPGCNIYDNCTVPTIWCAHNDPSYSGTQHGVPCFAIKAMYDFFATL